MLPRRPSVSLKKRAGAALVIVLCIIVLTVICALAFLSAITLERQTSETYSSGSEVRVLAESAVNIAIGQIHEASEQSPATIWTSQPGLLRTFDASGAPGSVYKLYSSTNLQESAATYSPAADVPADWTNRQSEFVDLNRPVISRQAGVMLTNYPILDPLAAGRVEGFSTGSGGVNTPVAWLYLLENGTLTNSSGLTAANPPVARIAFWTDDETSKININTASEGSYWDVPKSGTADDKRMATNQPAQREYQAYPGHPATTSLSPALWYYFSQKNPSLTRTNQSATTNTFSEVLYGILPRAYPGGSMGGTVTPSGPLGNTIKTDRLFTSVDELAFLQPTNGSTNSRSTNAYFDRSTLDQLRFFLTASSRAPELNVFNQPRVTIWPINANTGVNYRTAYDKLIAFASTINSNAYYFTRSDASSPTADFSGRNVQLYQYLQSLTSMAPPRSGSQTFLSKYGADRDQILTEIFDYIRCVNLVDSSSGNANFVTFTPTSGTNSGSPSLISKPGLGQVVPIIPISGPGAGTRGFGRYKTINRAIFTMAATATNSTPSTNTVAEAALFFETFSPAQGATALSPDMDIELATLRPFQIVSGSGASLVTNSVSFSGTNRFNVFPNAVLDAARNSGGYDGFAPSTFATDVNEGTPAAGPRTKSPALTGLRNYPFVSLPFTNFWNSTNNPTVELRGGSVRATLKTKGNVVQTIDFDFPTNGPAAVRMPVPDPDPLYRGITARFNNGTNIFAQPGNPVRANSSHHWMTTNDIVRSVEATAPAGDLRLLAATTIATNFFHPPADYSSNAPAVFSAMATAGEALVLGKVYLDTSNGNRVFGRLSPNSVAEGNVPANGLPPTINGATNANGSAGDWDTGIGIYFNGPLINKSDDGNPPKLGAWSGYVPYFNYDYLQLPAGTTFSSPSRQLPSAVMFGSLPTGVKAGKPWQTLLFNPTPACLYGPNPQAHPGAANPQDHLLLDLFHIPVVEPYAISEPFSTAGKVNMNYQIMPFTNIVRTTALQGIMRSVSITAINDDSTARSYKSYAASTSRLNTLRYPIQLTETLKAFDQRFATNGIFLSASEICTIPLIPDPTQPAPSGQPFPWTTAVTTNNLAAFWTFHNLTGDNLRENPYALLYPRLTTRSNTYTVHVWVQTLKKLPTTSPTTWTENRDKVTGEFRGSFLVERYLNPAESGIPDYATGGTANLNSFYRFRIVSSKQFNP